MPGKQLFEYAVIRVVPRVEREEFMNTGVIVFCARPTYLKARYALDINKLHVFCPELELADVEKNLLAFKRICEGARGGGPIALLDPASRFRWLTATRSTVLQFSKVHPGFCDDPEETLQRLFTQLVL